MIQTDMQEQLPITILADSRFSSLLKPLLTQLEMWINFQALKADWFGDEVCILSFEFTLVRTIEEQVQDFKSENWVVKSGYAYSYDCKSLKTTAFIAVADLLETGVGIEQGIKQRLVDVANSVANEHGLLGLSL